MWYYADLDMQDRAGITIYFSSDTGAVGAYCNIFALPIDYITPICMVFQNRHQRVLCQVKLRSAWMHLYS